MTRKIREAYYTVILEKNLTKEQIIEAYLNTISLGYSAYGVQAAANAYSGCELSLIHICFEKIKAHAQQYEIQENDSAES